MMNAAQLNGRQRVQHTSRQQRPAPCLSQFLNRQTRHLLLPPCRVTNERKEIWRDSDRQHLQDERKVFFAEDIQIMNPEQGRLENQVTKEWLDSIKRDDVDLHETKYWFTEPQGGWQKRQIVREYSEEVEVEFADAAHPGEGRRPIEDLQEGEILYGEVTDIWLYHGAEIDIGCNYDGLIPIEEDQWQQIDQQLLWPGQIIKVQVHKLQHPADLWRWPIQLTVLEPEGLQSHFTPPDEWKSPINMAADYTFEEMVDLSGRPFAPAKVYPEPDMNEFCDGMEYILGHDHPQALEVTDEEDAVTRAYFRNAHRLGMVEDMVMEM